MIALVLLALTALAARANDEKDYLKFAAELRQSVWADDNVLFRDYSCPEQYNDSKRYSAVILAASTDVEITRKSYLRMSSLFSIGNSKMIKRHELNRMLIKINDAAALKKFSEFDFTTFKNGRNNKGLEEKVQQVLGVRVIKPDGRIVDVNTDDFMTSREGKKDKEVSHKLAVPSLEVGDVMDIFTYEELMVQDRNVPHFTFWFMQEYPLLNYKVHCIIDKKFTVQYRTLNGAPDFAISTDDDGNTVLDAHVQGVERTEPTLWYNPVEQTPMTLLYAFDKSVSNKKMKSIKNRDVQANPDFRTILIDDMTYISNSQKGVKEYYDWPLNKKLMKGEIAHAKKMTDKVEAARLIYTGLLYSYRAHDDYNAYSPSHFIAMMGEMLKLCKIPYQYVISTDDENEPLDQLIYIGNDAWLIRVDGTYFAPPTYQGMTAGQLPSCFQGRPAAVISKLNGDNTKYDIVTLPQSVADDNLDQVTLTASIDGTTLTIDRIESRTGTMKENAAMLMTDEQEYEAYDKYLGRKKQYIENVSKRQREGTKQQFAKENDEQQENFKTEVELYHDQAAEEMLSTEVLTAGIDPQQPAFAYRTRYTMDGWVKKAGNNLIVSIGKLIGSQAKVEGTNRNRTADVDRRSPGLLTWDITVTIPNGCVVTPESLERLQQHVANSAGEFTSSATILDGQVHLTVTKRYNQGGYPASQWQELLQILDAADEFTTRQVVFKK
ncbi:MAG: hypothetical protein IJV05_05205 [Muribaculaceae bacterium]|nr:hypothetical protein [Muribaculaceae bacterium]